MPLKLIDTLSFTVPSKYEELYTNILTLWRDMRYIACPDRTFYYKVSREWEHTIRIGNLTFKDGIWYGRHEGKDIELTLMGNLFEISYPIWFVEPTLADTLLEAGYNYIFKSAAGLVFASVGMPNYTKDVGYDLKDFTELNNITRCTETVEDLESKDSLIELRDISVKKKNDINKEEPL